MDAWSGKERSRLKLDRDRDTASLSRAVDPAMKFHKDDHSALTAVSLRLDARM